MSGPLPLRERGETLASVATEAARARAGSGRLVLIRGATGTGRTALLEAVAEHAAAGGMRVLRARCSPEDTAVPFAAVHQLLAHGPEPADPEPPPPGLGGEPSPAGDGYDRDRAAWLWHRLRARAAGGPLLAAVDDVHLADPASRRWLTEAARRIDHAPVLLVVTERSQYDIDPPAPGLAHALSPALVRTHTLAPLGADAAAELVRAAVPGGDPGTDWVDDCVRAAASTPLLLRALLDDLRTGTGQNAGPAPVPESCAALYPGSYPATVSWWLESAGPATAEVARVLATLGCGGPGDACHGEGDAELLAEVTGADPARVRGWLTAMTRLGLLAVDAHGRVRYAHPLLRDAVLCGWPASRRRAAHRTVAEALLRRGECAGAVAGQLLPAFPVGAPWAVEVLLDAAAGAVRDGRADDALAFLRRALDEPLAPARRAAVLTELGSLEFAAARPSAGIPRLVEAVRVPGAARDRVRAAVALGTAMAERGEVRAALDVLRDLGPQLAGHPDLARAVHLASALLSDQDQGARREVYEWLRETAERTPGALGPAGQALLVRYESTAGLTSARRAMERVRGLLEEPADSLGEPFLLGTAAAVAQWADELDEAERLVRRGLAGQRASLLHPMQAAMVNTRADIAAARGDYAAVLALPEARPCPENPPKAARRLNVQAHAVIALVETGRIGEAERLAAGFDPRSVNDGWERNRFLYARGVLRAATGDPAGALDDFTECGRRQSARDVISPVVTPWRSAAAGCRLALGRPRDALVLAEEELRLAEVWGTPRLVGRALRALAEATGGRRGVELAAESVRLLRDTPVATELVPALIAYGRQLTASGERARAREPLREAAERAERLGAVRLRAVAEEALREGGVRRAATARTGSAALTGSERRIAALAADGRTNDEIAALLHVARRTVETHLTSAYRKLGIRRRTALAAALAHRPAEAAVPGDALESARPGADPCPLRRAAQHPAGSRRPSVRDGGG
ncbi:ATP-binding protein [Streptantibioticus cattleyicolor]|nr:LuxR family transcriptional regulator [Streptantibioticus cattleyicolor]CCB72385.1 protein of unknown function [Streptantibioticus cattleyicolor NRRL 8057 = DSM 46488]